MTTTLCSSGAVQVKAGSNATTLTDDQYTELINQAEGFVCTSGRYDFVSNYASISSMGLYILEDACSCHAAIAAINYDMSPFTSRTEAQVMLDVNYSRLAEDVNLIRDEKFRQFIIKGEVE